MALQGFVSHPESAPGDCYLENVVAPDLDRVRNRWDVPALRRHWLSCFADYAKFCKASPKKLDLESHSAVQTVRAARTETVAGVARRAVPGRSGGVFLPHSQPEVLGCADALLRSGTAVVDGIHGRPGGFAVGWIEAVAAGADFC